MNYFYNNTDKNVIKSLLTWLIRQTVVPARLRSNRHTWASASSFLCRHRPVQPHVFGLISRKPVEWTMYVVVFSWARRQDCAVMSYVPRRRAGHLSTKYTSRIWICARVGRSLSAAPHACTAVEPNRIALPSGLVTPPAPAPPRPGHVIMSRLPSRHGPEVTHVRI
jgi:hypothetical protein